ncbi:MAG: GntR family transcriptional regulator [Firmicutes bacterium]|nr:GntR family transcriptional regulator [Bacillota bacterium]
MHDAPNIMYCKANTNCEGRKTMSLSDLNLKNVSLSEQIFNALKEQIINGELKPGERLVIDRLASQIGVSSTPVRDALRLLISAGYAEKRPNDSIFVIELSKDDVIELFDMREILEGLAVRLVTQGINNQEINIDKLKSLKKEFEEKERELLAGSSDVPHELDVRLHDLVHKSAPNKRLKKQIDLIMNQTYSIRNMQHKNKISKYLDDKRNERLLQETQEHIRIIDKILNGDSVEAENMMREHIRNSKKDILSQMSILK